MSQARLKLEDWLKTIDVKGSVLDVGGIRWPIIGRNERCGIRVKSWDVSDYKILDNKEQNYWKMKTDYVFDLSEPIDGVPKFDNIFCIEVMQFIYNPVMALFNIRKALKDKGILYINFHFIYPHMEGEDYLRYTKVGIKKLLEETGFEIAEMTPRFCKRADRAWDFLKSESIVCNNWKELGYFIKAYGK